MSETTLQSLTAAVTRWHVETFGHDPINDRLGKKLLEESREVVDELFCFDRVVENPVNRDSLGSELADVLIVLCAIAGRNGIDLLDAAERKFETVRARGASQIERDAERGIGAE